MADKTSQGKGKWEKFAKSQNTEEEVAAEVGAKENTGEDFEIGSEPESEIGIDFSSREELERKLTEMEQAVDEYKDKNLRVAAQMKNLQDRTDRDISKARKFGAEKLLSDLLPVLDSLVQGIESAKSESDPNQGVIQGMEMTLDMFGKTLEKHGVEVINPARGDEFNPEIHEAMTMQNDPDAKPNTVLQVLQRGYVLNGRVLRAARVIVAGA